MRGHSPRPFAGWSPLVTAELRPLRARRRPLAPTVLVASL